MATLSDRDLVWAMRQRLLVIEPDIARPIQPASIDLRLGNQILLLPPKREEHIFDPDADRNVPLKLLVRSDVTDGEYRLWPGEFILACTYESIGISPQYEGIVTGKSSWARAGLQIESAGYVDPGWGCPKPMPLTLEIKNLGSLVIVLRPGMKICQLRVASLNSAAGRPYGHADLGSHYADSYGVVGGRFTPANKPLVVDDVVIRREP